MNPAAAAGRVYNGGVIWGVTLVSTMVSNSQAHAEDATAS